MASAAPSGQAIVPAAPSLVTDIVARSFGAGRHDLPVAAYSRRAAPKRALETLHSSGGRDQLLAELQRDFTAASATNGEASLLATWNNCHVEWFGDSLPAFTITVDSLLAISALFERAGYRSYPNYLSAVKAEHIMRGHAWSQILDLLGRWCTRSVLRGIDPPRQSCAIDILKVHAIPSYKDPVIEGGPISRGEISFSARSSY